jgi:GNAT superfamily N-acetyltransferase
MAGEPIIRFEKATPGDAKALALASWHAFDNDVNYGAPGVGGPPGYKSDRWQLRMMIAGEYYRILANDRIIGGFVICQRGYQYYEVARIFVHPDYQNQGIGTQAFDFLWQQYPDVQLWRLGTPAWNRRTRHFYRKVGFVEVGKDGHDGIFFEKRVDQLGRQGD